MPMIDTRDATSIRGCLYRSAFVFAVLAGCTGGPRYVGIDATPTTDGSSSAMDGSGQSPDALDAGSTLDGAPVVDAPPPCTWGTPTIVLNVNTPGFQGGPDVSHEGLTLYWHRLVTPEDTDLYIATRTVATLPFSAPVRLDELDEINMFEDAPTISRSGTEIFYAKATPDVPGVSIWTASRGSTAAKFSNAHSLGVDAFESSISGDGLTLYYVATNAQMVRKLTRPNIGGPWSAPSDVMPTMGYRGMDISANELKIVLSDGPVGFSLPPVQIAERATTTAPFGPFAPVPSLNVAGDISFSKSASFNADATQIYLIMDLPTGNGRTDIYVASCQ